MGEFDVMLFTTSIQVVHLFRVAGEMANTQCGGR